MFPTEVLLAYLAACVVVVLSPGPDNILSISRGLSQGPLAAALSALGAGLGIMVHTTAAALGLSLVIQGSPAAFWVVKLIGGAYLLWLGYKACRSGDLISFQASARLPLRRVLATGVLSNVLNPKPGLFVLAFLPQFADAGRGSVALQMMVFGAIFAVMTTAIFSIMGGFASELSRWLKTRPDVARWLNLGAGMTFIAAGLSVLALQRRG